MELKFCPNLNFMFKEFTGALEKFRAVKRCGFDTVEYAFPYDVPIEELQRYKDAENVRVVLINSHPGDSKQLGFAALPDKKVEFEKSIATALTYAAALNCRKVHIMSGKVAEPNASNFDQYECNLRYAAGIFEKAGILGLIEPISSDVVPNYFMNDFETAVQMIEKIKSPNLKLMLDVFHLQQVKGNLTRNIAQYKLYIGHVQIAQVPSRHGPDNAGEIDYKYVFQLLKELPYTDYIGLEYTPHTASTSDSLQWLRSRSLLPD